MICDGVTGRYTVWGGDQRMRVESMS